MMYILHIEFRLCLIDITNNKSAAHILGHEIGTAFERISRRPDLRKDGVISVQSLKVLVGVAFLSKPRITSFGNPAVQSSGSSPSTWFSKGPRTANEKPDIFRDPVQFKELWYTNSPRSAISTPRNRHGAYH